MHVTFSLLHGPAIMHALQGALGMNWLSKLTLRCAPCW